MLHSTHARRDHISPPLRRGDGNLKKNLIAAEEDGDFEVEEQGGVLNILFEEPPGKFVITPNTPPRQVWISALSTSFKLNWSETSNSFVLPKTGETLAEVVARVIQQHLGNLPVTLQ